MPASPESAKRPAHAAPSRPPESRFGQVRKTLPPGADGTKRHLARFGERLVCVRYRLDAERGMHLTTVEIVVDEKPIAAPAPERQVQLRIGYAEKELQRAVRQAGGVWQRERRVWLLPLSAAKALHLDNRIVTENVQI